MTLDCPMQGHGRNACVALQVEDADAYYREWCAKVNVLRAPKDEDWGARTFDLLDPSGNTIFVMGPVSGASQRGIAARQLLIAPESSATRELSSDFPRSEYVARMHHDSLRVRTRSVVA
jgi:hypothetical protein